MSATKQINKIKTLLGLEVKLEQMALDNGTILEAESFEVGMEIFVVNEEDRIPLPAGDYMLENGKMLAVIDEGVIAEIKDAAEEEAPEAEVEVEAEAETATPKKVVESISKEMFFAEIEKLRNEITQLRTDLSAEPIVEEVKEVELSAEPIKHNPEGVVNKKPLQVYSKNKSKSTTDIVFSKLFNK
jgi:hypothetical protein